MWLGTSAVIWLAFTVYAIWKFLTISTDEAAQLSRRARVIYLYGEVMLVACITTTVLWLVTTLGQLMLTLWLHQ